jgi:hypothetical protein
MTVYYVTNETAATCASFTNKRMAAGFIRSLWRDGRRVSASIFNDRGARIDNGPDYAVAFILNNRY